MQPVMPQIEKIIFLMLENRSLDHVLGWLYKDAKPPFQPPHIYPANSRATFDGNSEQNLNYVKEMGYAPFEGSQDQSQPLRTPRWNPNEKFEQIGNQYYWDGYGNNQCPRWSKTVAPPMQGFAYDYA